MNYNWRDIPVFLRTPIGRRQFLWSMYQRGWPILSHLARVYRQTLVRNTRIVTVVGSYGKSTTLRATACALKIKAHSLSLRNSKSFVARAVFRIRPYHRHAVIEVGIDGPGQMAHYAHLVRPDVTVVTSIGSEHNRSLHSLERTRAEKSEMIRVLSHTGVAVLNGDDTNVLWMKPHTRAKVVTFGLSEANDVRASDITLDWPKGTHFNLHAYGETRHVTIRLIGPPMVYPILAAIATGLAEGCTLDQILPALAKLSPTPGRLEPVRLPNGAYILRDDFKSPLETIDSALDVLSEIPARRRIVVLGDVSEPLGKQWQIYRKIGQRIGGMASRAIFITGKFRAYAAGAKQGGLPPSSLFNTERSVLEAVEVLRQDLDPEDVVLIKGRDTQRLDRITLSLLGRTVRCNLSFCNTKVARCDHCPMLERGWGKAPSYYMKG